jgi:uncharacterized protein (DUF433 family)
METVVKDEVKIDFHPYITKINTICRGEPIIPGTRTTVRTIVQNYKMDLSIEEILRELPHLTPAQVHDALSYYYHHQQEIEELIRVNEDEDHWKGYIKNKVKK